MTSELPIFDCRFSIPTPVENRQFVMPRSCNRQSTIDVTLVTGFFRMELKLEGLSTVNCGLPGLVTRHLSLVTGFFGMVSRRPKVSAAGLLIWIFAMEVCSYSSLVTRHCLFELE